MVRKSITCISLLFVGCGISYFCINRSNTYKSLNENELLMTNFFKNIKEEKNENNYITVLEIPKIGFKRGLFEKKNPNSLISKNIIFLDTSDMPDKDFSRVIIVGHSGDTSNSYFKYLYKLKLNDKLILYYKNIKYEYKIQDIYEITKNGTLALEPNKGKKTLTLVTCKGSKKQLVIISTLIKEEKIYA